MIIDILLERDMLFNGIRCWIEIYIFFFCISCRYFINMNYIITYIRIKSKAKSIEQQANEENKSKKSSKNNKVEPQNDEENKNPIQESNEEKKENPDSGEEGSGSEEAEEEEDDVEGNENEEYGGQLNATDKLSGKTPPNIKK